MGLLGRIAASVGGWLVEEGKEQDAMAMEKMKDDLLFDREVALEGVKNQYAAIQSQRDQTNKLQVVDRTAQDQQQTDLVNAAAQGVNQAQHDTREAATQAANIQARGVIDAQIEGLKAKYKLSDDAYQSALEQARQLAEDGQTIGHVAISPKGNIGFYSKTGQLMSETPVGTVDPNAGKTSPLAALGLGAQPGAGGAPTTGQLISANEGVSQGQSSPAAPQPSALKAQAVAKLGSIYSAAQADPDTYKTLYPGMFDPQGNLRPQSELLNQINTTYGGQ